MLKLYYKVFVDMYYQLEKQNIKKWKLPIIAYLSAYLGLIFMSLVWIIKTIFEIEVFPSEEKMTLVKSKAIIIYFIPAIILNYFVFMYEDRYKNFLEKYSSENGKYIIYFMYFAFGIFIFSIILKFLI